MATMSFWEWMTGAGGVGAGLIQGDPNYYSSGQASAEEYAHAIRVAIDAAVNNPNEAIRYQLWKMLVDMGAIQGDHNYYAGGQASPEEIENAINVAAGWLDQNQSGMDFNFTATTVDPAPGGQTTTPAPAGPGASDGGGEFTDPNQTTSEVGNTVIPVGATVVGVRNPRGSDAGTLFYLVYEYEGVRYAFEVGDQAQMESLFGTGWATNPSFDGVQYVNQSGFDQGGYVQAGMVDEVVGSEESFGSQIEVSLRAAGLEDLPGWIRGSSEAMQLIAEATVDDWSSGRLWVALSETDAFKARFPAMDRYMQNGITVEQAVNEYVQDESALRVTIRRFLPAGATVDEEYLATVMENGWTPQQANMILQATDTLKRRPEALFQANAIMLASGLDPLDEAGMINVLTGGAPDEVVEAFNTAAAAQALTDAGLDDLDIDLLVSVVDDVTTLRSKEDYAKLAQDLATSLIRNGRELDWGQYGLTRDDVIAAAFGESNPNGKSLGETINFLSRLERERQVASQGLAGSQAYIDDKDRLRMQGLKNL